MSSFDSREDYDVPRSSSNRAPLPPPPGASVYNKRPSLGTLKVPGGGSSSHLFYDTPPGSNRASRDQDEGIYDTPPSSKRTSCERTPPQSNRSSASRDSTGSANNNNYHLLPGAGAGSSSSSPMPPSQQQSSLNLNHSLTHHQHQPPPNNLPTFTLDDVRRRRSGSRHSDNCYETPPGSNRSSNRSSLERILSEEGPPIYESLSPTSSLERIADAESTSASGGNNQSETQQQQHIDDDEDAIYDTPPVRNHALSNANPASQTSLHSTTSSESLLSTGGFGGGGGSRLSQATTASSASLPDSARSSLDIPTDNYDVPPQSQNLDRSRKQLSMDSGLGLYDSPTKSRPTSSSSNTVPASSYSSSISSSSSQHIDDFTPPKSAHGRAKEFQRSRSLENSLDDDLYDTPKNNTLKASSSNSNKSTPRAASFGSSCSVGQDSCGSVYDVPPQVTRDSVISNRSDSSDESLRLSSSSFELDPNKMGMGVWDELLLDFDSALEVLLKRQQDVSKATSRLSGFVTATWRARSSLEKTLYDIKVSCSMVQNCLIEFVDFAQGTIANASKMADMQLANRLYKYVAPLQNTLELVNKSFSNLEEIKWQVAVLCEPLDKSKTDDLGQIALVSKDLMVDVKRVASFIQSNSQQLFRKASAIDAKKSAASKPPIGPKAGETGGVVGGGGGKLGNGYGYAKLKSVQQRPLPAVPIPEKQQRSPAIATATPSSSMVTSSSKLEESGMCKKGAMYAIKEALHKDDYAECGELFERGSHVYTNHDDEEEGSGRRDHETCQQEYDYVQLDDNDTLTRNNSRTVSASVLGGGPSHSHSQKGLGGGGGEDGGYVEVGQKGKHVKPEKLGENQNVVGTTKSFEDDGDNVYAKINNDDDGEAEELYIKTSELTLEDKVKDALHDDVDMIPVKESSTLERPPKDNKPKPEVGPLLEDYDTLSNNAANQNTDQSTTTTTTAEYCSNSSSSNVSVTPNNNDVVGEEEESSEDQDEKTPVNLSPLDMTNFPLPEIETSSTSSTTTTTTTTTTGEEDYDESTSSALNFEPEQLDPNDHQVLVHYAEQMNSHSTLLANSIDAFIGAVGSNQPPNVFISHSKFVIVSAHKLVHIGDTVHRNLASNAISARVMHSANHLCDCLKASVNATKMAALQYPSPVAIQEMVDKVIAVSHAAHQLKFIMTQAHRQ